MHNLNILHKHIYATHATHTTDWNARIRKGIMVVSIADTFNFRNACFRLLAVRLPNRSVFISSVHFLISSSGSHSFAVWHPGRWKFIHLIGHSYSHINTINSTIYLNSHTYTHKNSTEYSDMQCVFFFIECRQPNRRYWNKNWRKNELEPVCLYV